MTFNMEQVQTFWRKQEKERLVWVKQYERLDLAFNPRVLQRIVDNVLDEQIEFAKKRVELVYEKYNNLSKQNVPYDEKIKECNLDLIEKSENHLKSLEQKKASCKVRPLDEWLQQGDYEKIKSDPRFPIGFPSTDNANYLWIQLFYTALNEKGRAGFVMTNSASDARGAEAEIKKKLIQKNAIDVMIAIGSNFFYTVTLPCTLWFLDKNKTHTDRKGKILFIDARKLFNQIDRAHREFAPEHIEQISNIIKSYRKEAGSKPYANVQGLCKVASFAEIKEQGWSLNPGRYVVVTKHVEENYTFKEKLDELNKELDLLNGEAHKLEEKIAENVNILLRK